MTKRLLLDRRAAGAYGQDFLFASGMEQIGVGRVPYDATIRAYPSDDLSVAGLVITHNPEDEVDSTTIVALPRSARVVAHLHLQWSYLNTKSRQNLRQTLSRAAAVVVPAEFMRDELMRRFPNNDWHLIRYGFDTERYRPTPATERRKFLSEHSLPLDSINVIHVGRLDRPKGLQTLDRLVSSSGAGIQLWLQYLANAQSNQIAEYQRIAEDLRQRAGGRVSCFPDSDPFSDRPVRYADHLLSLSLKEVSPMVVLEGLLCGVPAIATRSTPFLQELQALGFGDDFLRIVELPDEISAQPREGLQLTAAAVERISDQILDLLGELRPTPDPLRKRIARHTRDVGFSRDRMLFEFNALYDEITSAA